MAKAVFEKPNPNADPTEFTVKANRRLGQTRDEKGEPIPLSGRNRRLYYEDLSDTEAARLEQKHREVQRDVVQEHEAFTEPTVRRAASQLTPRDESFNETSDRILRTGQDWTDATTMSGEEDTVPGTGWYFNQNRAYRRSVSTTSPARIERAILGGSAMSPMNSPSSELASAVELSDAHTKNKKVVISKNVADYVNFVHSKENDKIAKQTKTTRSPLPLVEPHHIGTEVSIKDLHPEIINTLSSLKRAEAHPEFDDVNSHIDWKSIRKGSPNVTSGVAGIRGAALEELAPPLSAPKVSTYTENNRDFQASPQTEATYRELGSAGRPGAAQPPAQDRRFRLDDSLISHVESTLTNADGSINKDDAAYRQLKANKGLRVQMEALHPHIVGALSHPNIRESHPDVHSLALSSANHPIVADTWVQGAIAGQPQASLIPEDYLGAMHEHLTQLAAGTRSERPSRPQNVTNIYKQAGSDVGYWRRKSLASGEAITDVPNSDIHYRALQHAAADYIVRNAAQRTPEVLGTTNPLPSVNVQEGLGWTIPRRVAGKDTRFNQFMRAQQGITDSGNPDGDSIDKD